MIANQQILLFIIKRELLSLNFNNILCFQSSSNVFSLILQSILIPLEVFRYQRGINPQDSIKRIF